MTKQAILDYAARNWGLEDTHTIQLFALAQAGSTAEELLAYVQAAEAAMFTES